MSFHRPWLYRTQIAAALLSLCVLVFTLAVPNWVEWLFEASPDEGDGSLERWVAIGLSCVSLLTCAWLAYIERRRPTGPASLPQTR